MIVSIFFLLRYTKESQIGSQKTPLAISQNKVKVHRETIGKENLRSNHRTALINHQNDPDLPIA